MIKLRHMAILLAAATAFAFVGCASDDKTDAAELGQSGGSSSSSQRSSTTTTQSNSSQSGSSGTGVNRTGQGGAGNQNGANGQNGSGTNGQNGSGTNGKNGSGANGQGGSGTQRDPYAGLTNEQIMQLIEQSRQNAITAKANEASPEAWAAAEAEYQKYKRALAGGTTQNLTQALRDLDLRYKGLELLAKAKEKKALIDAQGYASYDQKDYDEGASLLAGLLSADASVTSGSTYYNNAGRASTDFDRVLKAAYNSLATSARADAYKAKQQADSVKAYISRKEAYDHAVSAYKNGELRRSTNPDIAYQSYTQAYNEFTVLYEEISAARAAAQARVDAAKQRVAQSESNAAEADIEVPLGDEPVEGIVAADAKLLEDDDFSGANTATEVENPFAESEGGAQ